MSNSFGRWLPVSVLIMAIMLEMMPVLQANLSVCPTAFFNFGDSLTDTGNVVNAFPLRADPENSPYGDSFFGKPAKRFSNGRLVPDFFSLAFGKKPLLQPYVQAGAFDYRYGANFAYAGATASNDTTTVPFFLPFQISQFGRFQETALSEKQQLACAPFQFFLPLNNAYENALYTIELGGNDIINALIANKNATQILTQVIPDAMTNIANAIKTLYGRGARRFLLFNAPNAGCSTIIITLLGFLPRDSQGCVIPVNLFDQAYNAALNATVQATRTQFPAANIAVFNYYAANEEILLNPTLYGFNSSLTQTACCGAPGLGALNYNPAVPCGRPGATKCANPDQYVNWDGVHFTEAFYRVIARFALNGQFTDSAVNYTDNCFLSFQNFPSSAKYDLVYPATCDVTFS